MQADRAKRLRELWKAKGNPPCEHQSLDKEYILGGQTGDYVCEVCGKNFTPLEYEEWKRRTES